MQDDPIISRDSSRMNGRLLALPSRSHVLKNYDPVYDPRNPKVQNALLLSTCIDFPAMPDVIELARRAEYNVHPNQVMPDGIHQYKHTSVLKIPVSFKLHYADTAYCTEGALTLLKIAARLHSFILPIKTGNEEIFFGAKIGRDFPAATDDSQKEKDAQNANNSFDGIDVASVVGAEHIYNPVVCQLELMYIDENSPGIVCRGYVDEVSAKLQGPWLRGPELAFNLPTQAEYSFTFVHRPGHQNPVDTKIVQRQPQAFANDVRQKLYFTRSLVQMADYKGLDD